MNGFVTFTKKFGLDPYWALGASLVAQMVKNLPAMQKTLVWIQGQEDPLEKGVVTHSSILAWRIPWTEELCRRQSTGLQRVGHDWPTNTFHLLDFENRNKVGRAACCRDLSGWSIEHCLLPPASQIPPIRIWPRTPLYRGQFWKAQG